jgi:hypothetical protein
MPPETDTIVVDETFVYPVGSTDNPCPFELTYHNSGTFIVTTHLDADGTTVRQFARGTDFLETYSANGKEISSITPATIHFDPASNTLVGTGNQRHFIVPAAGVVYAQAGRFADTHVQSRAPRRSREQGARPDSRQRRRADLQRLPTTSRSSPARRTASARTAPHALFVHRASPTRSNAPD